MKKILIVEDEPLIRKLYSIKLQQSNYEVETANNGEQGFQKSKSWNPDLILLDILMPKVDGYAMLKLIRNYPSTKDIPVIILTNTPSLPNARECLKLNIVKSFLKVSITPAQLASEVNAFFKQQSP